MIVRQQILRNQSHYLVIAPTVTCDSKVSSLVRTLFTASAHSTPMFEITFRSRVWTQKDSIVILWPNIITSINGVMVVGFSCLFSAAVEKAPRACDAKFAKTLRSLTTCSNCNVNETKKKLDNGANVSA